MTDRPTPETDLIEQGMFGSDPKLIADFARSLERERDEAREQLAAERALADRLAWTLGTYDGGSSSKSYTAWKEARK